MWHALQQACTDAPWPQSVFVFLPHIQWQLYSTCESFASTLFELIIMYVSITSSYLLVAIYNLISIYIHIYLLHHIMWWSCLEEHTQKLMFLI